MYGIHVLTNIIVGGKYVAYYKSAFVEETNRTEKVNAVSAGAKFNLSSIGLDANGTWNKTEITERNKKNTNWECYIKSIGGSTSRTSITIIPNQSTSYTINLGAWTESVDDSHSRLVDTDCNATYPIYELIQDPIKKEEIKKAMIEYINKKKLEILPVAVVYQSFDGEDHFYTTKYQPTYGGNGQWKYEYPAFAIYSKQIPNTIPFYQYWNGEDHLYTCDYRPQGIGNWKLE